MGKTPISFDSMASNKDASDINTVFFIVLLLAHVQDNGVFGSIPNVKIEGPIAGYLFSDTRECSDGRILLGVTNDNTDSITISIDDPDRSATFVQDLSIDPGLTVVPWQTNHVYTDDVSIRVVAEDGSGATGESMLTLVVVDKPTFFGCPDMIQVDAPYVLTGELITIYDVTFRFSASDAVGETYSEEKTVTGPGIKTTNSTMTLNKDGPYTVKLKTTANGKDVTRTTETYAYYPVPAATVEFSIDGPNRPQGIFYPTDTVEFLLVADQASSTRPTLPNCTIDFGDASPLTEIIDADLTQNVYKVMLNVYHIYTTIGTYTCSIVCANPFSNTSGTLDVEIVSPTIHAEAELNSTVVAVNVDTGSAEAKVVLGHMYLTEAYSNMTVEFDSGLGGQVQTFTMPSPGHAMFDTYSVKGTYTLTVTFKAFGVQEVKTLTLKVGVLDFFLVNKPLFAIVDFAQIYRVIRSTETTVTNEVDMYFDPGASKLTFPINESGVQASTIFREIGQKYLTATMKYLGITEVCEYNVTVFKGCVSTPDLFQVEHRDPSTAMEVLISAVPTVSGRAVRTDECAESERFTYQWKLWRNTGTPPAYAWDSVAIQQPDANTLVLSKYILEPGLYRAWLELSVTGTMEVVSDTIHLEVYLPTIVAAIAGGGSLQQVVIGQSHSLDAATSSYDPASTQLDQSSLGPSSLTFVWTCYQLDSEDSVARYTVQYSDDSSYRSLPPCSRVGVLPQQGAITLDTSLFSHEDLALFEVNVTSNIGNRLSTAVTVIKIISGERPSVALVCTWNCEAKLLPNQRAVFEAQITCDTCPEEEKASWTYTWTLYKYNSASKLNEEIPHSSWDSRITSEPTAKSFDTVGGWWEEDVSYTLKVEVRFSADQSSAASTSIFPDLPPYGGTCDVTPKSGRAVDTLFKFSFPGWKDEYDRPRRDVALDSQPFLLYSVQQDASVETPVLYKGGETVTPETQLTSCGSDNNQCKVLMRITDPYEMETVCEVTVQVTEFIVIENITKDAAEAQKALGDMNSNFEETIATNDPVKIVQTAATYSSVINTLEETIEPEPDVVEVSPQMFEVTEVTKEGELPPAFDPETAEDPVEKSLALNSEAYMKAVEEATLSQKSKGDLTSPAQVELFAKSATTVTSAKKVMTGKTLESASNAAVQLSSILEDIADSTSQRTVESVDRSISAVGSLIDNIVDALAMDVKSLEPNKTQLGGNNGLSPHEQEYFAGMLAKRRRFKVQTRINKAPTIVRNMRRAWANTFRVTRRLCNSKGRFRMKKKRFSLVTQSVTLKDIQNGDKEKMDDMNGFSVGNLDLADAFEPVNIQVVKTKNPFIHGEHSKFITSDVVVASVATEAGTKVNMKGTEVEHDTGVNCTVQEEELVEIHPRFIEGDASKLFYHSFEYPDANARACIMIRATTPHLFYRLYVKIGSQPTDVSYDYRMTIKYADMGPCSEVCLAEGTLTKTGQAFIGLRPLEVESFSSRKRRAASPVVDPLVAPYLFGMSAVACYTWDDVQVDWLASKCKMSRVNGTSKIKCVCGDSSEVISALSYSFSPNTIDFSTVFSQFDIAAQGAVLGTLLSIYFIFLLLGVWADYMDRASMMNWGVFPLVDNYAVDDYYYLLTVHTGLRKAAGTKSKVGFCVAGSLEETGVRVLSDGVREGFPTGSVVHLVMAVPRYLGELETLRIWHDNSGKGDDASWYLDRVDVMDLQKGHVYHFLCEEWLTPEEAVDRIVQPSDPSDLESLRSAFFTNTKQKVTEDHIWLSVFLRPERSRFSRVERVGCCVCFLALAMITSAMFYQGANDADRKQPAADFEMGPIRLSLQQVYYSVVSAVIASIPLVLIIYLFRKARLSNEPGRYWCCGKHTGVSEQDRKNSVQIWDDWEEELKEYGISTKNDDKDTQDTQSSCNSVGKASKDGGKKVKKESVSCCARLPWMAKLERHLRELEKILLLKPDSTVPKDTWPRVWRHLAWVLLVLTVLGCSFFVMLYSMQWGKDISEEWLSSFLLSFLQSLCVVDPFKVLIFSFLASLFLRKTKMIGVEELNIRNISDVNRQYGVKEKPDPPREVVSFVSPLSDEELQVLTLRRRVQVMVRNTIRELLVHAMFLLIVCSLCYCNRSNQDFRMFDIIKTDLVHPKTQIPVGSDLFESQRRYFSRVETTDQYYEFLEDVLTPWLFPSKDWKGDSLVAEDRQFTAVPDLYRLGAPRLRQLRMKPDDCASKKVPFSLDCVSDYSMRTEETTEFCVGWNNQPCPQIDQLRVTAGAWYFRNAIDIWGIPIAGHYDTYGGGGYISNLDINLMVAKAIIKELKEQFWIDRQTRAVFLEFTLYCANTNRFAYVILLAEFPPTGGVVPFINIYPFTVYNPAGALGTYLTLCEIMGVLFTVVGVIYVIFVLNKDGRAAFRDLWFSIDFMAVIFAFGTIAMFSARLSFAREAVSKMKEDPSKFVNFQHVVVWDTALLVFLAGLVAIGCIRLLKLAGYSKKTMRVYRVLKLSTGHLPGFFIYICLILFGFALLGMLWFGKTSHYYRNFLSCMENLFTGILGHTGFKDTGLPEPEKLLTISYFILFTIVVVHLLSNFFLAILSDLLTVNAQRNCNEVHGDNAKIFSVMWDSFLRLIGRKRDPLKRLRKKKKNGHDVKGPEADRQFVSPEILSRLSCAFNRWLESQSKDIDMMIIGGDKPKGKDILKSTKTPGNSRSRGNSADPKKQLKKWKMGGEVHPAELSIGPEQGWAGETSTAPGTNTEKMENLLSGVDTTDGSTSRASTAKSFINVAPKEENDKQ